jgi:hypothetical protein
MTGLRKRRGPPFHLDEEVTRMALASRDEFFKPWSGFFSRRFRAEIAAVGSGKAEIVMSSSEQGTLPTQVIGENTSHLLLGHGMAPPEDHKEVGGAQALRDEHVYHSVAVDLNLA